MKKLTTLLLCFGAFILLTSEDGCNNRPAQSTSGIEKTSVQVKTDLNGKTIEQNAIIDRLTEDNKPGSIKHLYIISSYSGQVIMYSTVKGKVTSSGKRLSPAKIDAGDSFYIPDVSGSSGNRCYTNELLSDDGTYGSSSEYIYWWDSKDPKYLLIYCS